VFISGGNPHITSWFCGVVLGSTTISKMVSEPLQDSLGHLLSGFRYRALTIYVHEPSPIVLVVRGFVKSLTSDMRWSNNVFICGRNPHHTSRFCGVVLGLTTFSKMVLEHLQDPLDHLLSGFLYQATHHLCPQTKPNNVGRDGCVKSLTSDRR